MEPKENLRKVDDIVKRKKFLEVADEDADEVFLDTSCKFIAERACEKVRKERKNVQTR